MGIALSTAGVTIGYAVEETVGERPTTGYKNIPDVKSIPEMNPEPETLESTTLAETEYKTYIEGLKDLGGALSFTANLQLNLKQNGLLSLLHIKLQRQKTNQYGLKLSTHHLQNLFSSQVNQVLWDCLK